MNELIPVVEYQGRQGVNARDLHQRLEVGRDFTTWIKDRIEKYGFAEDVDYHLTKSGEMVIRAQGGGHARDIYFLYLQMAKEIAIVENNEKGREIRRYLITVEEAWNTPEAVMAWAQQMGAIPQWKEPSAARLKEFRMAYDKGVVTVNEYRLKGFNLPPLEGPVTPPLAVRPARVVSGEAKIISEGLLKFVDEYLELTENLDDYIKANDLYNRYVKQSENPISRWTFVHTMKGSFSLTYKQKKIGGYPTLVFMGAVSRRINNGR
jgi:phage anti-repressor protein